MTARPKRQRTNTPPGVKPKPRKLTEPDIAQRAAFFTQEAVLQQALAATEPGKALERLYGAWTFWREDVNKRYGLTQTDQINDDGSIN